MSSNDHHNGQNHDQNNNNNNNNGQNHGQVRGEDFSASGDAYRDVCRGARGVEEHAGRSNGYGDDAHRSANGYGNSDINVHAEPRFTPAYQVCEVCACV
jgi:hypothetical protein